MMGWLVWLFAGLAVAFFVVAIIFAIVLFRRSRISGDLFFTPALNGRNIALFVELRADPKLYLHKKTVTFNVRVLKAGELPDSQNNHIV